MIKGKIVTVLLSCSTICFGGWPTYHGQSDLKGVADVELSDNPKLLWRFNAGGEVYATPVSDGKRIFFSAKKGRVVALDQKGSKVWEKFFTRTNDAGKEMPLRFEAPLACMDGMVFAGSSKGTVFALDTETGDTQWKYETDGIITGSPNFVYDRKDAKTQRVMNDKESESSDAKVVVMDQSEGVLHCIDMKTGKMVWKSEAAERCDGAPGVADGRIAYGSCLAALHVYDTEGKHLKDIQVGGDGQIAGGVAIDGTTAFAGLRDGALVAIDLKEGEVLWSSEESEEQTFSTPAVTGSLVIYSSDDGFVYAVKKADGELVWKFDAEGQPYSPVATKHHVAVTADGVLYVLNLVDGAKVWAKEISDEITSPAIIGGMLVVGADDGTVSAYGKKR